MKVRRFVTSQFVRYAVGSVVGGAIFIAASVYATSTISTNITTDGTLTSTGALKTFSTITAGGALSVNGAVINLGTGSATTTITTLTATLTSLSGDLDVYGGEINLGSGSATTTFSGTGVGIGVSTTTPSAKFSIQGDTSIGVYLAGLSLGTADLVRISTSTASATSTAIVVSPKGQLGVGATTSPYTTLTAVGTAAASNFNADTPTATSTFQGSAIIASKGGNFGVGTTTPAKEASVTGSLILGTSYATTSLIVDSTKATTGGCINLRAINGSWVRIYATTTAATVTTSPFNIVVEAGSCQ